MFAPFMTTVPPVKALTLESVPVYETVVAVVVTNALYEMVRDWVIVVVSAASNQSAQFAMRGGVKRGVAGGKLRKGWVVGRDRRSPHFQAR
jgi:hypothetical protein